MRGNSYKTQGRKWIKHTINYIFQVEEQKAPQIKKQLGAISSKGKHTEQ